MRLEIAMFVFPVVLVGVILQFTPLITRPGIFFGATVDPVFPRTNDGRRLLRAYRWQVAFWTIAAVLLTAVMTPRYPIFSCFAPLCGLMAAVVLTYRRKFHQVHTHYGIVMPEIRRASLSTQAAAERFDLRLLLPPYILLGVTALYLWMHSNQIPQRFPIHWDEAGQPNGWASRDWVGVYYPLMSAAGLNLFTLGLGWLTVRFSRKTIMQSITVRMVQVLPYPLTFVFLVLSLLPLLHTPPRLIMPVILAITAPTLLTVFGLLYWSYRKVSAVSIEADVLPEPQSDTYWKAGMFYYNPNDPAVFVSARVGVGHTMNFASKWGWAFVVLWVAILVASIVIAKRAS